MKSSVCSVIVLVFCSILGVAQAPTAAPAAKQGTAAKASAAAKPAPPAASAEEPVIRVNPPCPKAKPGVPAVPCRDTVSRREFELLLKAAGPSMTPPMQRSFATNLARMLAYSNEAARLGLQNAPDAKAMLEVSRMQAMAQLLGRKLQGEALKVNEADIQAYYKENQSKFESAVLERILIPHKTGEKDVKGEQDFADKIRARWVAGEDPEKLQAEAFTRVGNTNPPPPVKVGERKRTALPPEQQVIFALNAGEVSQVFPDPSASIIYKVVSKSLIPIEQAREEITRALATKRLEETVKALDARTATTLNEAYFNSVQAAPAGAPAARPGGMKSAPPEAAPKAPAAKPDAATPPPATAAPATAPPPTADKEPK